MISYMRSSTPQLHRVTTERHIRYAIDESSCNIVSKEKVATRSSSWNGPMLESPAEDVNRVSKHLREFATVTATDAAAVCRNVFGLVYHFSALKCIAHYVQRNVALFRDSRFSLDRRAGSWRTFELRGLPPKPTTQSVSVKRSWPRLSSASNASRPQPVKEFTNFVYMTL